MAQAPETLTLATHRDRGHWWQSVWLRRILLLVPIGIVVVALANLLGQRMQTSTAAVEAARLTVSAPTHARSGLMYSARFRIDAIRNLRKASLLLDQGWADGYTVNGAAPQPLTQGSDDGRLNFGIGHIAAGHHATLWLSLQVNPTTLGHHAQTVWLYDNGHLLAAVHRSVFIFP